MTLLLVFALLTGGLTALFLGVTIVAQGYLYQEPVSRLPLRAAAGGVLLGGFITLWAAIDKNKPGRYDTFFNFSPYTTSEFSEFEAVRWPAVGGALKTDANGKPLEEVVKFKRNPGGTQFVREGTSEVFILTGSDNSKSFMTGAIRVKGPGDPEPVRYNAIVDDDPRNKTKTYSRDDERRRFVEEKGERYVKMVQMGTLFVPSTATIVGSLALNFVLLVLWLVVMWPVLRYSLGHSLGLAAVGTLVTMLLLMPLLFKFNRSAAKPAPAPAPAVSALVAPGAPKMTA
ncbi:MAG TPA: hypothetical protein VGE74_06590 [Gemmata sp.]